ncbi:hypothetical protein LWI28_008023 [Acer negundo]|uniref:Retrotransposon Copia-like N-terminal domain-containing protein n=1 Tax=Acer negundo TaxID=4023 RepID=A0AAD5IPF9_ACENE|nr:hypothetical protein LWI28_008023 [Acer negundo]
MNLPLTVFYLNYLPQRWPKLCPKLRPQPVISKLTAPSIGIKLYGSNHDIWPQVVEMYISVKDKLGYINGELTLPSSIDLSFFKWRIDNAIAEHGRSSKEKDTDRSKNELDLVIGGELIPTKDELVAREDVPSNDDTYVVIIVGASSAASIMAAENRDFDNDTVVLATSSIVAADGTSTTDVVV